MLFGACRGGGESYLCGAAAGSSGLRDRVDTFRKTVREDLSSQVIERAVSREHRMQVGLLSVRLREL